MATLMHCQWEWENGTATMENNLLFPQKAKQNYQMTEQFYFRV